MALEDLTGTKYIDDLNSSNPTATDVESEGDDHIRGIKNVLKTSFPSITGAVTATHTELNYLASQEGGFLLKAISTGGGTADAITADFTPNVSLTDGVTVIVRAQGANTITTPTFNPDSLGAKTIVKHSNEALLVGDIAGASHELLLKYNSSNDNWTLLNPKGLTHRGALVYRTSNQTIATATATEVNFDNESYDTESIHDNSTNNTRMTVPSGVTKVRLKGKVTFNNNATGRRELLIYKNGTSSYVGVPYEKEFSPDGSEETTLSASSPVIVVTGGDYFELSVYQTSGGNLDLNAAASGREVWFEMEIIE